MPDTSPDIDPVDDPAPASKISWAAIIVVAVVIFVIAKACRSAFAPTALGSCRELASSRHSEDNRYTEVTFTDGNFIKGQTRQISNGVHSVYGYWEREANPTGGNFKPEITFFSPVK